MTTLAELKRLAEAATPGPWFHSDLLACDDGSPGYVTVGPFPVGTPEQPNKICHDEDTLCEVWHGNYEADDNSAYIAAVSPDVLLRLLAVIEAADEMDASDGESGSYAAAQSKYVAARAALERPHDPPRR